MHWRGWMKIEQSARCLILNFSCILSFCSQQKNRLRNHKFPFVASTKSRRVLWQSIQRDYLGEPFNNSGEDMIKNDQTTLHKHYFSLFVGNLVLITVCRFLISWTPKLMGDQWKKPFRIQSGWKKNSPWQFKRYLSLFAIYFLVLVIQELKTVLYHDLFHSYIIKLNSAVVCSSKNGADLQLRQLLFQLLMLLDPL